MHYDNYNLHCVISIHALLAESDYGEVARMVNATKFLSTLSLRRATHGHCAFGHAVNISIHALLAESDGLYARLFFADADFYPRSPCGERPAFDAAWRKNNGFLSTLSLRRAT